MPPNLPAVLTSLGARPSREAFDDVTALLGGSLSPLAGIRRNRLAEVDASEFSSQEVMEWLVGLPINPDADVRVAWAADRTGARMKFATFAGRVSDLWFPAMDDVLVLAESDATVDVLVLDHEERLTFSRIDSLGQEKI